MFVMLFYDRMQIDYQEENEENSGGGENSTQGHTIAGKKDGHGKLKPFDFFFHGSADGFSRRQI